MYCFFTDCSDSDSICITCLLFIELNSESLLLLYSYLSKLVAENDKGKILQKLYQQQDFDIFQNFILQSIYPDSIHKL